MSNFFNQTDLESKFKKFDKNPLSQSLAMSSTSTTIPVLTTTAPSQIDPHPPQEPSTHHIPTGLSPAVLPPNKARGTSPTPLADTSNIPMGQPMARGRAPPNALPKGKRPTDTNKPS
jgi:hypothetical protein